MGKLQICLDINPVTGKKDITVSYRSDEDALPMEHEDEHRRLVDALIEGDLAKAPEMREVVIEREQEASCPELEQVPVWAERGQADEQS
jgi:hypothetical protein